MSAEADMTNGATKVEETNGEKSIIAMIAAGDFDAGENAAEAKAAPVEAPEADKAEEKPTVADAAVVPKVEEEVIKNEDEAKAGETAGAAVTAEEIGSADDDKYKKEDAPRRVLVKNIDRKKTPDEIEDYFFDNYADCSVENVYTCMVWNARSNKKLFFGNAIISFDSAEKAKAFLLVKLRKEDEMTWKRKLVRHGLEEVQRRREERAASVVSNSGGDAAKDGKAKDVKAKDVKVKDVKVKDVKAKDVKVKDVKAETPKAMTPKPEEPKTKQVACINFPTTYESNREVEQHIRECHENVKEVRRQGPKVVVTFKDQRSADRFAGLAYVKYRGVYINRAHYEEPKPAQKPAQPDRRAEKRKLEPTPSRTTVTPGRATVTPGKDGVEKKSVQFKLKGVFGEGTGYRDIKAVLEQEHGLDVRFVSLAAGEARVRLLAGGDTAAEVVYRLARDQVKIKSSVLVPAVLTPQEEAAPIRAKAANKAKRERLPDWSDY